MKTIVTLLLFTFLGSFAIAQSSTLFMADRDNTLYQSSTGALSNGAGDYVFVGRTGQSANYLRRAVLHFNISTLATNAVIDSVKLHLTQSSPTANGSQLVSVHKINNSWGEGTSHASGQEGGGAAATTNSATWIHRFSTTMSWASAGGDFNSVASGSRTIGANGAYTIGTSAGMLSDVQAWHANSANNHGWLLKGNEASSNTAQRFCSRENTGIPPCGPMITVFWHTAPLSLVKFDLDHRGNDVLLRWIYNNPEALSEIEVQHAGNDRQFKTFRSLEGSAIKAESSTPYYNLGPGSHYFRLVFVLKDGQKEFSAIRALEVKERGLKVYPNPVEATLNLSLGTSELDLLKEVRLHSLDGKLIRSFGKQSTLDLGYLPKGIYLLNIEMNNSIIHKRIIKN